LIGRVSVTRHDGAVAYRRSVPLERWLGDRRAAINTLAAAHASMGEVDGPGRPLEIGRPLGHAYILRTVAEFQGFVRDVHDLAVQRLVELAGVDTKYVTVITEAASTGRQIDAGNPTLRNLQTDFRRIGVAELQKKLSMANAKWAQPGGTDKETYEILIKMRNSLAHGNQGELDILRGQGLSDTVSWTRQRLPSLNRIARALDHVVWDHLKQLFGLEPW
jgi:hypothetical protein